MNKNKKILEKRAQHIKNVVNKSKNTTKAIKKLSESLYLSERTIERDLKR
jgi:DeoR/GlpR family transcriptional regulator of sugar metabolism